MSYVKELFESLKEVTSIYKEKNKDTSVVKLLDRAIKSIDTAVKTMDSFLKKKGVDLGKLYQESKKEGKGLLDKTRDALERNRDESTGSLFTGLKNKGLEVGSDLLNKFSKFTTTGTPPPEESEEDNDKPKGVLSGLMDKVKNLKDKKSSNNQDLNGDGISEPTWIEKAKQRQEKRKEEVEAEKAALAERNKKDPKGGMLDGLMGKILSLGGTIVGGFMTATKFLATTLLTKLVPSLVTGLGGMLLKILPGLTGGLTKGTAGLIGTVAKEGAKLAGKAAIGLGKAAFPLLGKAAMMAGRAGLMLASGPVGWGVALGTAVYGAYKFYKYMTRNDIKDDIYGKLTRLRLLSYGFNDDKKDYYSKLFELELLMKENLKFDNLSGKLAISKPTEKQVEKIYELFSVDPEHKERKEAVNRWFSHRFIPAFHAYISALWKVNNSIYVDSIDALNPVNIEQFLTNYVLPTDAIKQRLVPVFDNPESKVTQRDLETVIAVIRGEVKSKVPNTSLKPIERMEKELANQRATESKEKAVVKAKEASTRIVDSALSKANMPVTRKAVTGSELLTGKPGVEGESKPDIPSTIAAPTDSTNPGNLVMAGGQRLLGGTSLTGITTKLPESDILNLDPDMLKLFTGMALEYKALTNKSINVNEAFRSRAKQEALYKKYGPGRAAKPGRSLHEFGLAIDIPGATTRELDKLGLLRKYGFTASVGGEDWHLEPIGVSVNYEKAKHDMAFRKDAITSSPGRGGGGYGLMANAKKYSRNVELQRKIFEAKVDPMSTDKVKELAGPNSGSSITYANETNQSTTSGSVSPPVADVSTLNEAGNAKDPIAQSISPTVPKGTMTDQSVEGESKPNQPDARSLIGNTSSGYGTSTTTNTTISGNSPTMDVSNYGQLSPVAAIKQASAMTGMDEDTLLTFAKVESSLKPAVKNKNSSATGLFQITGGTWDELVKTHGPKYGLPPNANRDDPLYNALMAAEYAKKNLKIVEGHEKLGLSKSVALYLTHHFGPYGGKKVLQSLATNPNAPMHSVVSQSSYNSNKAALAGKTAKTYIDSLNTKFQVASNTPVEAYNSGKSVSTASDNTMLANNSITPPSAAIEPSMKSSFTTTPGLSGDSNEDTGFMKASYSPTVQPTKPTLTNTAYDITRTEVPIKSSSNLTPTIAPNVDFSSMEGIMSQQLSTLTQIATLMSSIDNKLDIEKILSSLGNNQPKETERNNSQTYQMKNTPSTGVNLTRRTLT